MRRRRVKESLPSSEIACLKLLSLGVQIDTLTEAQERYSAS